MRSAGTWRVECRWHCGSDWGRTSRPDELGTDEWVALIDRLAACFNPREVLLVITGGEPLCRPGIEEILDRIRACGFAWGMVTNGWGLPAQMLDALLARGLASLTVSLDGLAPSHDWLRGVPGSFDLALGAIRAAVAAGPRLPAFDVVTCANPRNCPSCRRCAHSSKRSASRPGGCSQSSRRGGRGRTPGCSFLRTACARCSTSSLRAAGSGRGPTARGCGWARAPLHLYDEASGGPGFCSRDLVPLGGGTPRPSSG